MFRCKITTYSLFLLGKSVLVVHALGQNVYPVWNPRELKNFISKDTLLHLILEFVVTFLQNQHEDGNGFSFPSLLYECYSQCKMFVLYIFLS